MYVFDVFVFKQKTAYEVRISDWSSDVCSSDLDLERGGAAGDVRRIDRGDCGGILRPRPPDRDHSASFASTAFIRLTSSGEGATGPTAARSMPRAWTAAPFGLRRITPPARPSAAPRSCLAWHVLSAQSRAVRGTYPSTYFVAIT